MKSLGLKMMASLYGALFLILASCQDEDNDYETYFVNIGWCGNGPTMIDGYNMHGKVITTPKGEFILVSDDLPYTTPSENVRAFKQYLYEKEDTLTSPSTDAHFTRMLKKNIGNGITFDARYDADPTTDTLIYNGQSLPVEVHSARLWKISLVTTPQ